ncbi:ubiquinol oxidase subunit II [Sphingomonas sp. BN140010]|uniref:Ubiquinol oxidase polypeptide II n=1 Tax=Sphingomonas arvum TaxID=2992113 RepID=A0ABT3JBE1_9SPHN|nr:ubiquinol oxidase subunit II [Sphingomonas sp. BN140010]MCW3796336.1 ubiquinol oxidase subunit II [Sphingomonas sp. BN140010]
MSNVAPHASAYMGRMLQPLTKAATRMRAGLLCSLPLILSACDRAVLNPAGQVARQQRDIIAISTGLMLLIIVPVMILTVIFAWRYRKGKGGTYDPNFDHSTALELVIWSAPLLIIIILGALTWSSTHLLDPFRPLDRPAVAQDADAPRENMLRVQVVSMDWKWLFIYPDQGIATVNELVLPVGRQVRFDITSTNMMSTFYAPTMAGMIYAMPGMQSTLHAVLDKPVTAEGLSGMYTGAGFADQRFKLYGVPTARFDQWVAEAKGSGRALDLPTYMALVKPSEKVPVMHFAAVQPDLFRRVMERCVEPGKPCMSDVMRHDMGRGGGNPHDVRPGAGMTPGRGSAPLHGDKPEGAIFKSPEEKGSGEHFTKPTHPNQARGVTKPGDATNRNMTELSPWRSPLDAAAARA